MKRFAVTAAQGQRANPLGVKRLPAHGKFRLLRVILRMLRRAKEGWSSRRCVLAVPFLALGNIELEAVRAGKVPRRAGHRNSHFLIGCPNVPVHPEASKLRGTDRVKRGVLRVGIVPPPLPTVLEPEREGDRPGGKIEQIAVDSEISQRQLKLAGVMQGNIDPANGGLAVATEESQEGIKRCSRIGIQQRFAQARLAHHATKEIFLVIPGITKTQFPIPILEVIAKFSHLTAKSGVEQNVVERSLGCSDACVVNGAKPTPVVTGQEHRCRLKSHRRR